MFFQFSALGAALRNFGVDFVDEEDFEVSFAEEPPSLRFFARRAEKCCPDGILQGRRPC